MKKDNPASRLLNILQEGKKIGSNMGSKLAWSKLLNIPDKDSLALMQGIASIISLVQELSETVLELAPEVADDLKPSIAKVEKAIANHEFHQNWHTFIGGIDDTVLNMLSIVASLLDKDLSIEKLDLDLLDKYKTDIQSLLNEILNPDTSLSAEFKSTMKYHLQQIIENIDNYFINGRLPIHRSIQFLASEIYWNEQCKDEIVNTDTGKKTGAFILDIAKDICIGTASSCISTLLLS
jgi:hypothetical protein